jgi:hypothetical protein
VLAPPLTVEESVPGVVDAIATQAGKTGIRFLAYRGPFLGESRSDRLVKLTSQQWGEATSKNGSASPTEVG